MINLAKGLKELNLGTKPKSGLIDLQDAHAYRKHNRN